MSPARSPRRRDSDSSEGYLASVSDLMSGLIFIFVITLAVFALRLAQAREDKEEERIELEETQKKKEREIQKLQAAKKTRSQILRDLQEKLRQRAIRVEVEEEQGILRLGEQGILFGLCEDAPAPEYARNVGTLAEILMEVLPCYVAGPEANGSNLNSRPNYCSPARADADRYLCDVEEYPGRIEALLIEGHTDSRRIGGSCRFRDNLELSAARASEIHRRLTHCEPGLEGLRNTDQVPIVSVSGYADRRLVDRGDPESEVNRRIDLRIIMEPPIAPDLVPVVPRPAQELQQELEHDR